MHTETNEQKTKILYCLYLIFGIALQSKNLVIQPKYEQHLQDAAPLRNDIDPEQPENLHIISAVVITLGITNRLYGVLETEV